MLTDTPSVNAVTEYRDQAEAPPRCAADVTPANHPRQAKARGTAAIARRRRLRRAAEVIWRVVRLSYRNPLAERPDLVEDDYYRLRNQPRGY